MAPTEGRVARPERRWGCRHGTPNTVQKHHTQMYTLLSILQSNYVYTQLCLDHTNLLYNSNVWNSFQFQHIIRPPGMLVPKAFCFSRDVFYFFLISHRISELPRPIATKLYHVITIYSD